jgi:hypothetical protein
VELKEYSKLKIPLEELGYTEGAKRALGSRANENDIEKLSLERFIRKNKKFLNFLDIEVQGSYLFSKGKAGVVPILPAKQLSSPITLIVTPVSPWYILSEFVGKTSQSDWLDIKQDWAINRRDLDLELWYFARPFIIQARAVLEKPGRSFLTKFEEKDVPRGDTDWDDYSINKAPFGELKFKNKINEPSLNSLPHSLMKWCVIAIKNSIKKKELVSPDFLNDLSWVEGFLKDIEPMIPIEYNLRLLPNTGAWTGYTNVYIEIRRLAAISGILNNTSSNGCAFSIKAEKLFELMVINFASEWGNNNGFRMKKESDDSSRIGLNPIGDISPDMLNSLRPDAILVSNDTVIIIDAKYKMHYDLAVTRKLKNNPDNDERYKEYRHDIHQVLSYGMGYKKTNYVFLLSHPSLLDAENKTGLKLWKLSGTKNCMVGLLPISFNSNMKSLKDIKKLYFDGLIDSLRLVNNN